MYVIRKAIYCHLASCIAAWNISNVLRCISLLFSSSSCSICHSRAKMACSSFFLSSGICRYNPMKIPSFLVLFAILAEIRIPESNRASCRPDAENLTIHNISIYKACKMLGLFFVIFKAMTFFTMFSSTKYTYHFISLSPFFLICNYWRKQAGESNPGKSFSFLLLCFFVCNQFHIRRINTK